MHKERDRRRRLVETFVRGARSQISSFFSSSAIKLHNFHPPSNFHGDVKRAYAFSDLSFRSGQTFGFGFFSSLIEKGILFFCDRIKI